MDAKFISFFCEQCGTEIEASPDMVGEATECPACGAHLVIPEYSDDGVRRHEFGEDDPDTDQAMKSRTIRIELGDL